jgi:AraC-like DNA-binding protein/mannose-6-phosphate isomerase-like protein (cupin superfamily)
MPPQVPTLHKHTFHKDDAPFYVGRRNMKQKIELQTTLKWLHTHPGLEIGGVVAGKGVQHFNGKQFPMKQGDVFVIDPVFVHEIVCDKDIDFVVSHLTRESVVDAHLDKTHLTLMRPFSALQGGMPPVVSGMEGSVAEMVRAWEFYNDKSESGRQRAFSLVVCVLSEVAQRTKDYAAALDNESWRKNHDLVSHATEYINARFRDDFSIDDLAEHCKVSKSRLSHAFKEFAGDSPMGLRTRVRISRAVDLLRTTDMKITVIALECGFKDLSAFYRLFKKLTNLTPADVRKGKG